MRRASAAATAEQRLTRIAAMSQRLAELESGAAGNALASRVQSLEARCVEAAEARARCNLVRETMKAREAEWNAAREASSSREKLFEAAETKRKALSIAQDLSARIEALASELNADAATPAVVEKLAASIAPGRLPKPNSPDTRPTSMCGWSRAAKTS